MKEAVVVDVKDKRQTISRDIYGHFSEHLGRCIYGGFWVGRGSAIPNIHGYNKAVVEAFKALDIPNLRWPGGCFADEYHWRDGIGRKESRKRMINTNWGGVVEDNSFGTHEFFGLCDELDCKPYISGNVGSGSVREMSEWIEYMTFGGDSPLSRLRAQNGRREPWHLPYFGIGNESWGGGGSMRPEFYADQYRRYQTYVRQYGSDKILKIASGPNVDDYNWTEVLMREAGHLMDGLSLHYYTYEYDFLNKRPAADFNTEGWYRHIRNAYHIEELIRRHSEIMDKYDEGKRVSLVVDEWGSWFKVEEGTNPGFLYQQNTVRDAVVAGIHLNIFNNHSDRVRMANLAQAVNVLQSPVLTKEDKIVLTPTWHVLHMYRAHQGAMLLGSTVACASAGLYDKGIVLPSISVSASERADEKTGRPRYFVTLVNADADADKSVDITLANLERPIDSASAVCVTGEKLNSLNSFESPDNVTEQNLDIKVCDAQTVNVPLKAHSVTAVTVAA